MTAGEYGHWAEPDPYEDESLIQVRFDAPLGGLWIPDALRTDPYVAARLRLVDGWETRGRPGVFAPVGVVDHHTACMWPAGHTGKSEIANIIAGRDTAPGPISQLFIPANAEGSGPLVYVLAAGRANHANGDAANIAPCPFDTWTSGGRDWNGCMIGIEACGPPERWPDDMIELRARVTACLLRWMGVGTDHLFSHDVVNIPNRIDPSGPWRGQPSIPRLQAWNLDAWRYQVAATMAGQVTPPPPPEPEPIPPWVPGVNGVQAVSTTRSWYDVARAELGVDDPKAWTPDIRALGNAFSATYGGAPVAGTWYPVP